ncbi:Prenyltransferase and squalene oxidase repeat protein [Rubripirellula obstinata]|uniref:Prenyltransferase and squalene oxidase repeat protein n=1 Tax=Rubripirellula obstinata TaxID=406547 RepID=A0A5B1CLS5_9BACT|nr:prenyltransferase/squalene oxidase repeat-containing protein [Rubripirellula obstinata]KAA1260293.1 Prenyltransferase and squalene oxidase repeat protein [Rubripirellula obstinata]
MASVTQTNDHDPNSDRMWPLDVCIAGLAGLVMYLIATRLSFSDSRPTHNAWTYVISVPLIAIAMDIVLRRIASHYVQKSIQIGFLFSVSLHLLLLMLATGVLIFSRYNPQSVMGVKPERSPVSRTVPEYLFKTTENRDAQPDWSKPADAETASPVAPREQRKLPPVEHSAAQLEMPRPPTPIRRLDKQHLLRRETASESKPQPSNSPAKLARSQNAADQPVPRPSSKPIAPSTAVRADVMQEAAERSSDDTPRRRSTSAMTASMTSPSMPEPAMAESKIQPLAGLRQNDASPPRIGDMGLSRPQRRATAKPSGAEPAGAAPAPRSVPVARQSIAADRMIAPIESTLLKRGKTTGAQLTPGTSAVVSSNPKIEGETSAISATRNQLAASAGLPNVDAGQAFRRPGRSKTADFGVGSDPAGMPNTKAVAESVSRPDANSTDATAESIPAEMSASVKATEIARRQNADAAAVDRTTPNQSPSLDLMAATGPIGFADAIGKTAGVVPSDQQPKIASLDLTTGTRQRRDVGGPATPFGTKVASVESFNRRIMRTEGGRAPTPSGMVGPATEEAIERGLAYLDSIQNEDGSWSLQGHGGKVILRSDTAATGLCLLAYQGAGYTHRQHQYADTVSRGLKFLIDNQKTNGDLYRKENATSDRNVAFYSHGIAALAMSEAYGMTQDPDLKKPAQLALNYIAATQHRTRGGWRYTPQVSADTSVTGWMMMALKSGQLSGLNAPEKTYKGIDRWLSVAQSPDRRDRYRYDPYAPNTPTQRHGSKPTPTMTSVGMLMRMYSGWRRDTPAMQSAADYLLEYPPQMGTPQSPQRDAYYWYYATQVMFHMGGDYWKDWNRNLNPVLLESQLEDGPYAGSWDPMLPVRDRWSVHAGRLYVTTMNLLNLEVYYRHLPIYEDTAE